MWNDKTQTVEKGGKGVEIVNTKSLVNTFHTLAHLLNLHEITIRKAPKAEMLKLRQIHADLLTKGIEFMANSVESVK